MIGPIISLTLRKGKGGAIFSHINQMLGQETTRSKLKPSRHRHAPLSPGAEGDHQGVSGCPRKKSRRTRLMYAIHLAY
jgi:hypothetical protein